MSSSSSLFSWFSDWLRSLFFAKELEVSIVGLQASGKTSFVNVLSHGQFSEDVVPTVAFNLRRVKKGAVTFKIWDVAGQPKFRNMWERYCRGVQAIVYVVDAADTPELNLLELTFHRPIFAQHDALPSSTSELHALLSIPELKGVPLLILGNKSDLEQALSIEQLIKEMRLEKITNRPVSAYAASMKTQHNIDIILAWLSQRAK